MTLSSSFLRVDGALSLTTAGWPSESYVATGFPSNAAVALL